MGLGNAVEPVWSLSIEQRSGARRISPEECMMTAGSSQSGLNDGRGSKPSSETLGNKESKAGILSRMGKEPPVSFMSFNDAAARSCSELSGPTNTCSVPVLVSKCATAGAELRGEMGKTV